MDWNDYWEGRHAGASLVREEASRAHREMLEIIERWEPAGATRALDVGFGAGVVTCLWAAGRPRASVIGVDPSARAVAHAARRAREAQIENASFEVGAAERLPVAAGELDLVWSDQVLQYVSDEVAALRETARVLRPGGRAIAAVPNALNPIFRGTLLFTDDRHGSRRTYSRRKLAAMADAAGLRLVGWDGYLPAYPLKRIGYFYLRAAGPAGMALERATDRLDAVTDRLVSRRLGFALVGVFERQA